ncbi:MAG: hypothetical protein ACTHQQ_10450, partial [Solirubrobacteraceae bacterium]
KARRRPPAAAIATRLAGDLMPAIASGAEAGSYSPRAENRALNTVTGAAPVWSHKGIVRRKEQS